MPERSVWIGGDRPVFGMYHAPAVTAAFSIGVLFCSPFGWEDMASYPSRRGWAQHLAAEGRPVLRFDLPGAGQSAGGAGDAGLVAAWVASVGDAVDWLRDTSSCQRVAVIGIGLGGLLALQAAADGAPIDDLALWAAPASGRVFARTLRAFSKLQDSSGGPDPVLPEGWMQSGGYMLSAETTADVGRLRPDGSSPGSVRRALLAGQDSVDPDPALVERLTAAGVEVELADGQGWGEFVPTPEFSRQPAALVAHVDRWLAAAPKDPPGPLRPAPAARDALELETEDGPIREIAFAIPTEEGRLFGVLAEAAGGATSDLCLVCLPAWAERCSGPNRAWVEAARRHAARGVTVLRIDLIGIGDSDGSSDDLQDLASIWDPGRIRHVRGILDALQAAGHGPRFALVGLCSGGFWATRTAAEDPRVSAALGLNPSAPAYMNELRESQDARKVLHALRPGSWRKLLRGEIRGNAWGLVWRALKARTIASIRRQRITPQRMSADPLKTVAQMLDAIEARGGRITIAYSRDEEGLHHLGREGVIAEQGKWSGFELIELDSDDHNLRTAREQRIVHELIDALVAAGAGNALTPR